MLQISCVVFKQIFFIFTYNIYNIDMKHLGSSLKCSLWYSNQKYGLHYKHIVCGHQHACRHFPGCTLSWNFFFVFSKILSNHHKNNQKPGMLQSKAKHRSSWFTIILSDSTYSMPIPSVFIENKNGHNSAFVWTDSRQGKTNIHWDNRQHISGRKHPHRGSGDGYVKAYKIVGMVLLSECPTTGMRFQLQCCACHLNTFIPSPPP